MKNASTVGCAAGVLVHPLLFLLAFAKGVIFGHPQPQVMSATSAYGAVADGLAGGRNAVEDVLIHYIMTLGLVPIVVSLTASGIVFLLIRVFPRANAPRS